MKEQVAEAEEMWNGVDDGSVPSLLNKTAVRKVLSDRVQVSDYTINFLDITFYCILKFITSECEKRCIKRLTWEHIRDILSEERGVVFNIGNITYKNAELEEMEDHLVERVFKKIVMRTFGSAITEANKKEEFAFEEAEFPAEDGVENGE